MARLPSVGGDQDNWGTVLNEYLNTAHNTDGTLKLDVKNIADLSSVDVTTITDKQQALVAGYYAPGDGGGGQFYYDAAAADPGNGGTIIAPSLGRGRWFRNYSGPVNVKWFGARGDGVTDDTRAVQSAIDHCASYGGAVYIPGAVFLIYGTLVLQPGVVLRGENTAGEYYHGFPMSYGSTILKNNDPGVQHGPAVQLASSSGVEAIFFKCTNTGSAASSGLVSFGAQGSTNTNVVNASITSCCFTLVRNGMAAPENMTIAISFPERAVGYANYFHRITNVVINECDVGIAMSGQCNANILSNIITRECHIHYRLDGSSSECIENSFSNLGLFSISSLSPSPVGFHLSNRANNNNFTGYCTEMYGKEFVIDGTCSGNIFLGSSNEAEASHDNGQINLRYAVPTNVSNKIALPFIMGSAEQKYVVGGGSSFKLQFEVSGELPQQNCDSGALTAGSADNKTIFRFPAGFKKSSKTSFLGSLKVFAYGAFGNGCGIVTAEFAYSMRDATSNAGLFSVLGAARIGSEISGLYFLTGVLGDIPMGVALVGGNYGPHEFEYIRCVLDVTVLAHGSHSEFFDTYEAMTSISSQDVTSDDVADKITLLSVGSTNV